MRRKTRSKVYDPAIELEKGATLDASSYDKTQKIKVSGNIVTVGGKPGRAEISGIATGRHDGSIAGTLGIWLSIFRYMRPDGTIDHVAGWNIMLPLAAGQTPMETAKALVAHINAGKRPYKAVAAGFKTMASIAIVFTGK
ncbi:MAG: hypothetical protein PHV33_00280 [Elusimicrobiales bacterium]|nr:hypothetical protein [Elusimicrobiales bacterium]